MSNGSTFVSLHFWTNNVRQFDPSLTGHGSVRSEENPMGRWSEVDIRADMGFNTFKSAVKRFPFFSLLLPWYDSGIEVG